MNTPTLASTMTRANHVANVGANTAGALRTCTSTARAYTNVPTNNAMASFVKGSWRKVVYEAHAGTIRESRKGPGVRASTT